MNVKFASWIVLSKSKKGNKILFSMFLFRFYSECSVNSRAWQKSISMMFIPNRTFLVSFGGISGEFSWAMVRILARRSRAKIPMMASPNELDMPPKRPKKVRLDIYRAQLWPSDRDIVAISGQSLDIARYQDNRHDFWLENCEYGYGMCAMSFWFSFPKRFFWSAFLWRTVL